MSKACERGNRGLTQDFVYSAPPGRHLDRDGLYLLVSESGARSWTYRKQHNGKRYEVGLGSAKDLKLRQARDMAGLIRADIREGKDPRARLGRGNGLKPTLDFTFAEVLGRCFEAIKPSLKDGGKAGRWLSPLETHVLPKLGKTDVAEIDAPILKNTLAPIWKSKPDTARKALNRIGKALDYARKEGATVDRDAVTDAKALLGAQPDTSKRTRHTPWDQIPAFYSAVCGLPQSPATFALRLALLTAHRSSPVRKAMLDEFDLEAGVWTVPAEKLKGEAGKTSDIRCPLSPEAVSVIRQAAPFAVAGKLFPAERGTGFVSDVGVAKVFKRLEAEGTTHGLRTSFGDWCEQEGVAFELAERCLQHAVGNKVARAYRRDDLLERRREVMDAWADYATSETDSAARAGLRVA